MKILEGKKVMGVILILCVGFCLGLYFVPQLQAKAARRSKKSNHVLSSSSNILKINDRFEFSEDHWLRFQGVTVKRTAAPDYDEATSLTLVVENKAGDEKSRMSLLVPGEATLNEAHSIRVHRYDSASESIDFSTFPQK